ncbi:MAG: ComEC/Rec2 family competence protein [Dysgonomonas sp.]
MLGFIRRGAKYYWLKPISIILLLWIYAFVTGLPSPVVRASMMLSIFCVSEVFGKKSFSIHALFISAFFMLLYNPFLLFEIGFQLSFMSVLYILLLQPKASALIKIENKYLNSIWQMFTLSFIAQLATFPICLYYFGTFPTYFFIGNMFIVPLVSVITYAFGGIILAKLLSLILPDLSFYIYYLPVKVLQMLVDLMTSIIGFIEKLPLALIDHMKTSFLDLVLIYTIIVGFLIYLYYKKPRSLIITMSAILLFISIHVFENMKSIPDSLTVYNRRQATEIRWNTGRAENVLNTEDFEASYKLIAIKGNKALIVSSDIWKDKLSQTKFDVDNLILINDNSLSLYSLTQLFSAKKVVLDASLSVYTRMRLVKECKKLNIPCHDVVVNGAFSLNF